MTRFGNKMQNIGSQLSATVSLPILGMGVAALKAFGDIQRLEAGLAATMGSAEGAKEEMVKLQKIAESPALGFEQAIQGSIQLQNVGYSADQARVLMEQLANTTAIGGGTVDDLSEVTRQFSQMQSKGKILEAEMRIIKERMPAVGKAMQDAFGTQSTEAIQEMGISTNEFIRKLLVEMEKMPRVEGGFSNSLQNVGINLKLMMARMGESINSIFNVQGTLDGLGKKIEAFANRWDSLSAGTKRFIVIAAAVVAAIGPMLVAISSIVKMAALAVMGFKSLLGAFTFLISPVGLVVVGVVALAAALIYAYQKSEKFRAVMDGLGAVIVDIVRIMKESVVAFVDGFEALKEGEFRKAGQAFKEALIKGNPVTMAFTQGGRLADTFSKGYEKSLQKSAEEGKFDPYKDKDKLLANANATGMSVAEAFAGGMDAGGGDGKGFKKIGDAFHQIWGGKGVEMQAKSTFSGIAKYIKEPLDLMKQGGQVLYTWENSFFRMADGVERFAQEWSGAFQSLNDVISLAFQNRQAAIDAHYDKEKKRIEGSRMTEEQKQKALQNLDEETDKKRRKLARQQAIREKMLGIIQATIATAVNVTKSLANPILAGIIGALGAAQIALIASQKIPALAKGGLAYGPSMAMVGDNRNARVDPEVIAPLSKLKDMMGGNVTRVEVIGRIAGRDILLAQERAQQDRERTRGF
jgi:tape measure domain-containing protein